MEKEKTLKQIKKELIIHIIASFYYDRCAIPVNQISDLGEFLAKNAQLGPKGTQSLGANIYTLGEWIRMSTSHLINITEQEEVRKSFEYFSENSSLGDIENYGDTKYFEGIKKYSFQIREKFEAVMDKVNNSISSKITGCNHKVLTKIFSGQNLKEEFQKKYGYSIFSFLSENRDPEDRYRNWKVVQTYLDSYSIKKEEEVNQDPEEKFYCKDKKKKRLSRIIENLKILENDEKDQELKDYLYCCQLEMYIYLLTNADTSLIDQKVQTIKSIMSKEKQEKNRQEVAYINRLVIGESSEDKENIQIEVEELMNTLEENQEYFTEYQKQSLSTLVFDLNVAYIANNWKTVREKITEIENILESTLKR